MLGAGGECHGSRLPNFRKTSITFRKKGKASGGGLHVPLLGQIPKVQSIAKTATTDVALDEDSVTGNVGMARSVVEQTEKRNASCSHRDCKDA